MEYKKFSSEQLDRAKNADLIDFLGEYMGLEFKKAGRYYQCKQHNSLVVYADRKGFVWNSRSISGGDTIDFLRKVEGKSFPEAVEAIVGEAAAVTYKPAPKYKPEPEHLVLPEKADGKYSRVFAYLSQTRKISSDVITDFMKADKLYQDKKGNCVFVGFDEHGTAKFGSVRGTLTEKKYRGDCKNSDKRYAFNQMGTDSTRLYIFEAPIDLMSHCTMTDLAYGKGTYKNQTRLALCGSSDVALEAFLERHKEVKVLNFRLDNDEAGRAAVAKYTTKYQAKGYEVHCVFSKGKDVNEDLINRKKEFESSKQRK
ncbi:MAG: DUF3991 domain-containing protein [Clostridia bacterium]|nr:DUF3991 domain-containing protein [Clostridia bacterium]